MKRCTQCGVLNADHLDTCGSCAARGDSLVPVKEEGKAALAVGFEAPPPGPAAVEAPPPEAPHEPEAAPARRRPGLATVVLAFAGVAILAVALAVFWKEPPPDP